MCIVAMGGGRSARGAGYKARCDKAGHSCCCSATCVLVICLLPPPPLPTAGTCLCWGWYRSMFLHPAGVIGPGRGGAQKGTPPSREWPPRQTVVIRAGVKGQAAKGVSPPVAVTFGPAGSRVTAGQLTFGLIMTGDKGQRSSSLMPCQAYSGHRRTVARPRTAWALANTSHRQVGLRWGVSMLPLGPLGSRHGVCIRQWQAQAWGQ